MTRNGSDTVNGQDPPGVPKPPSVPIPKPKATPYYIGQPEYTTWGALWRLGLTAVAGGVGMALAGVVAAFVL